jgi:septal ring factor EnvC (AmiA/AmiB activator)
MTVQDTPELSVAAAQDEVDYLNTAIDRVGEKIAKLKRQVTETEQSKKDFKDQLVAAKRALSEAQQRDTTANAGAAEAEGDV